MSNERGQEKRRVKSLAETDTKKKYLNNKWRRLCSVTNCTKQVQKEGLCIGHYTEKYDQKYTTNIAVSDRAFAHPTTEESDTMSNNPTNLSTLTENHTEQDSFEGNRNIPTTTIQTHSSGQSIAMYFIPEKSTPLHKDIGVTDQLNIVRHFSTSITSGKYITKFLYEP
ncbi:unnamed protein product [Rotaria sp. Silwood2]|nr:unnamed protein product [Rotaria sp. Silwood2]CAF4322071.1 unnamed protein product [Rotaria sp. Silwood2]CAF4536085.1 unnamed protein product [Rotaria sp. Silwood2]